jgi:hypothetical protein
MVEPIFCVAVRKINSTASPCDDEALKENQNL